MWPRTDVTSEFASKTMSLSALTNLPLRSRSIVVRSQLIRSQMLRELPFIVEINEKPSCVPSKVR